MAVELDLDGEDQMRLFEMHEIYFSVAAKMDLYGESWTQMHDSCLSVAAKTKFHEMDQYRFSVLADLAFEV